MSERERVRERYIERGGREKERGYSGFGGWGWRVGGGGGGEEGLKGLWITP